MTLKISVFVCLQKISKTTVTSKIWNIVLSQFNADPAVPRSEYKELPHKNIDTGAGLERLVAVIQGAKTNFETDLFMPIIREVEKDVW